MRIDAKLLASIIVISILIIVNIYPQITYNLFIQLKEIVLSGGILGFLLVMIIQSIVSVIPAETLLLLGGAVFGLVTSFTIGITGLMAGALINYAIGLKLGRTIVEKIISRPEIEKIERFFNKHGAKIILALRFIPWISFDAISYFSGMANISVKAFTAATFLGTIPRALFYSYLGEMIGLGFETGETNILNYLLLAILLIIILAMIFSKRLGREHSGEA